MIQLYQAGGAGDFTILQDRLTHDQCRVLFENAGRLLRARSQTRAAEILLTVPFHLFDATNHFGDEFSMLYAIVALDEYERLRKSQDDPLEGQAFHQIANVLSEIGAYIRFIAIELALENPEQPSVQSEYGLKKSEINKLVYRYIGVSGGYLGDFSYRSHNEFYIELDLDVDPYKYNGTTRERFIKILSETHLRCRRGSLMAFSRIFKKEARHFEQQKWQRRFAVGSCGSVLARRLSSRRCA